ncbi:MAG: hypothetical protein AMJ92_02930 [candidate division Zixibacteria bacterium SM23_81]|nr:MAG: hypothetical protein AMJ92_02930 [candidate division Zixibacteria bacterium SM23_81]
MRKKREIEETLRNKRRKQILRRLQEREWKRQVNVWPAGSRVYREDLDLDEMVEDKDSFRERF